MNAVSQTGADGFLARFDGLKERLPGDRQIRERAASLFRASGLPTIREEAWKYTSLRPVSEASFHEPLTPLADCADLLSFLPLLEGPRLVFVDGRFREDLSALPAGIRIDSFAESPDFGTLARPESEPLVAL